MLPLLVVCTLSAQSRFAVIAGLNRGDINVGSASITFENTSLSNTLEPVLGARLGLETLLRNWDLGLMFTQRRYLEKSVGITTSSATDLLDISVDTEIERSIEMKYLSLYGTYPIIPGHKGRIFAGLEFGVHLSGSVTVQEESGVTVLDTVTIPAIYVENTYDLTKALFTDYGLLVGGDLNISNSLSLRASFYMGLSDIFEEQDAPANPDEEEEYIYITKGQHRGIQVMLVYQL